MAVRRRRPLVPPPYPRRNRYTPSSIQTALHSLPAYAESSQRSVCLSSSNRTRCAGLRLDSWIRAKSAQLRFCGEPAAVRESSVSLRCPSSSSRIRFAGFRSDFKSTFGIGITVTYRNTFHRRNVLRFRDIFVFYVFANFTISLTGVTLARQR